MRDWLFGVSFWVAISALGSQAVAQAETKEPLPSAPRIAQLESAAKTFLSSLNDAERTQAQMRFFGPERVGAVDESITPTFCAVLAWCPAQGISQCDLDIQQRILMYDMLRLGLTESGLQTVQNIVNRQAMIGQLDDAADKSFVSEVASACPENVETSIFETAPECLPDRTMPDLVAIGGKTKPLPDGTHETDWEFSNLPGLEHRYAEFCDYGAAVFGEPGTLPWAIRFEGHHLSVNITVLEDADGQAAIYTTPLFLGSFPVIVPPSPAPDDLQKLATWQNGQSLLKSPIDATRAVIGALPVSLRETTRMAGETPDDVSPLSSGSVPPWLSVAVLPDRIESSRPGAVQVDASALGDVVIFYLSELYEVYFSVMLPEARAALRARLTQGVTAGSQVELLWDSSTADAQDGNVYLYSLIGGLELELLAGNQWSVQSVHTPTANHLHSILRDRNFDWTMRHDAGQKSE